MSKKFSQDSLNYKNLHPDKHDYYMSGRIKVENIEESSEIKSSVPLQVRINGGEWVDIRSIDSKNTP